MKEQLQSMREKAAAEIGALADMKALEDFRVKLLGKKGELTAILKQMGKLTAEERPVIGQLANDVRTSIEAALTEKAAALKSGLLEQRLKTEAVDVTMPGIRRLAGRRHPLNIVLEELKDIFRGMGYTVVDGPEIEETKYVFDMLNTDEGHPARDPQDTFYITDKVLLRTQTSTV
ncbi:MAG: phenylalanine--tRNA ligase subunit alpha, partial [Ruminiclostridium sp.]|nr:phenylalanine--tRNA ligase subunit alpha [Ruminiclostridium sp.]